MPQISMLIKPASGNCNLNCKYCFYHATMNVRSTPNYGMMSIDTLEVIVKAAFAEARGLVTFAFQGGEPTLIGLPFYKKLIELVERYNTNGEKVNYAIQTNGLVIDDDWAQFFADNNFLVGISLDGTKEINDMNRINRYGEGSYNHIKKAIVLFDKYGVEYNILTVVSKIVAEHGVKIYNYFKKQGYKYLQFIPCLDAPEEERGCSRFSLTVDHYKRFLMSTFDLWYEDFKSNSPISVRYFDNLMTMLMGLPPESCGMSGICSCQFVIEADGGVYPCDFYVIDKWRMGNVNESGFRELFEGETCMRFLKESTQIPEGCKKCKWFKLCRGGCRRDRDQAGDFSSENYFCKAYKEFFAYSLPKFGELISAISTKDGNY